VTWSGGVAGRASPARVGAGALTLLAATLVALQTYGSNNGDRVHFEIGKKPTKDGLLNSLVEMLIRFRSRESRSQSSQARLMRDSWWCDVRGTGPARTIQPSIVYYLYRSAV
jgi:hypothetical protein